MSGNRTNSGKKLNEKWNVNAQHALFHKDGTWYNRLERFPGAYFDPEGYVLFKTEYDYKKCQYLKIGNKVNITGILRKIPGYKKMV